MTFALKELWKIFSETYYFQAFLNDAFFWAFLMAQICNHRNPLLCYVESNFEWPLYVTAIVFLFNGRHPLYLAAS